MKFWKIIRNFVEKYPPNYFIKLLRRIIDKMLNSISNSGNSIWRFLWIFPLLISIVILQILIAIKYVLKNIFEIIKFILRFIRKLIITLMEELEFYWTRIRNVSSELLEFLRIVNEKLIEVIKFQASKLGDKNYKFSTKYHKYSFLRLGSNIITNLVLLIIWFVFGTTMSLLLFFGAFIIIYPFLHQWIRVKIFNLELKEKE